VEAAVTLGLALDGVLALALPLMAWRVLASPDLRRAIVLFMALGLLAALAWARLAAPDIALVEAAVGTGVTGALLMSCLPWAGGARPPASPGGAVGAPTPLRLPLLVGAVLALAGIGAVIAGLAWAIVALPPPGPGLSAEVLAALPDSGVTHPVTAVLLNYRAYDTFLEILVLVAAAVGIDAVLPTDPHARALPATARTLVGALSRLLLPGFILVAGYLVWKGAHAPGGAFQAGAVLAAGGVLLLFARRLRPLPFGAPAVRLLVLSGPILFFALAALPLAAGTALLTYPNGRAGTLILALESVLVVTIGLVLVMFFPARVMASSRGTEQ
jgi:multisubunit Na+/H+ antiporter MnhB subunit